MLKGDLGVSDLGSRTIPSKNLRSEYAHEEEFETLYTTLLKGLSAQMLKL